MKKVLLLALAVVLFVPQAYSQLREVNITYRTQASTQVIEGRVESSFSFWDDQHHNIYTAHKIEVYKLLKGALTPQYIEVITPGGIVGMHKEIVEPSLELKNGDVGIFFLKNNSVACNGTRFKTTRMYEPEAGPQGFIAYNEADGEIHDRFRHYQTAPDVYAMIEAITGQTRLAMQPYKLSTVVSSNMAKGGGSITSFSPTTITAGTASILTINGSGFGSSAGNVSFSNADDGGATFVTGLASEIISWNDTQIQVEVNSDAGTGSIRVTTSGGTNITSASSLTVSYAQLNATFDPGGGTEAYQTRHINRNGNGGYIWQMHTDFDASAANASFVRAFDTWRCSSGIYWEIGSTTTTDQVANDDINIIRFDNGSELPNGVLGRCTSRWSGCGGATIQWYVEELDIVFDDGTNWNFATTAPAFSEYDFESVALHELGHGHQMGHVINTNDVMHYAISNGEQQRTPSANNDACAADVQSRSTGGAVCSTTAMSNYSCSSAPTADFSGTPTTICAGESVSFTDASTESPTSWSWDFGDGGTSTQQNPSYTYNTAGTYTVTLTATNAAGSDSETKTNYITVNANPDVSSTSSTDETCAGNDGTATVNPSGGSGSYTYSWTGGQTTQTATGLAAGTYNVTVTDASSGCDASTSATVNDGCSAVTPVADFTADDTDVCLGTAINFTDNSTNTPTSWSWNFGDGNSSTQQNPSHTYASAGTYTVSLTATNAAGSDTETKTNYITVNANPNVSNTSSTDETCPGNDGTATVLPTDGSGSYTYAWTGGQTTQTATGLTAGTYNVTVTDASTGCDASTSVTVNDGCSVLTPVADFTANTTSICPGGSVNFTDNSTNVPTSWSWDFGDGNTSTQQNPSHTYANAGTYTVSLTATNVAGSDTETKTNYITVNSNPNVSNTSSTDASCGGSDGTATVNPTGGSGSYAYAWSPGGLTTQTATGLATGTYTVTVTDVSTGCDASTSVTVNENCVPNTALMPVYCGSTLAALNTYIKAQYVAGADLYEFRIQNSALGYDETITGLSNPRLTALTFANNIQSNTTYDITVRARVGGVFGNFGTTCAVTTPGVPNTRLYDGYCGTTVSAINTPLKCYAVAGADYYEFRFVNTALGFDETIQGRPSNPQITSFWYLPGVQANTTYDIEVRASVNGTMGSFAQVCQVTTPSSTTFMDLGDPSNGNSFSEYIHEDNNVVKSSAAMTVYPNPNDGNEIGIRVENLSNDVNNTTIEVFDLYGKRVYVSSNSYVGRDIITRIRFGESLATGIYLVRITTGEEVIQQKITVK